MPAVIAIDRSLSNSSSSQSGLGPMSRDRSQALS